MSTCNTRSETEQLLGCSESRVGRGEPYLSRESIMLTRAFLPTVRKNSNIPKPFVQSRLLTTSTLPPPPPLLCPCSIRLPYPLLSAYAIPRSKNRWTCCVMPATFRSSSAGERAFRSVLRPDGSPIEPVAPPISSNQLYLRTTPMSRGWGDCDTG